MLIFAIYSTDELIIKTQRFISNKVYQIGKSIQQNIRAQNWESEEMDAAVYLDKCKLQEKTKHPQMLNLLKK